MNKFIIRFIIYYSFFFSTIFAQQKVSINNLYSDYVLKENILIRKQETEKRIKDALTKSLNKENEETWRILLNDLTITNTNSESVNKKIIEVFNRWDNIGIKLKHAVLEYISANYNSKFSTALKNIFINSSEPKIFAQTALNLIRHDTTNHFSKETLKLIKSNFAKSANDPTLYMLEKSINDSNSIPPILDLLKHKFQMDKTIIYSLHRKNREQPGLTVIKDTDGKFVRNEDGTIFHIPQLACSISGLPGYIIDGNTPQGIFSIVGWYISPTKSIGPTPIVLTRIPFGKSPAVFYHGLNKSDTWNIDDYLNLFPASWQNYIPISEAYFAGKIGRRLIVMHGSADDLNDYRNKKYFPLTPTRGCLSAKEIWSEETGKCIESDQVRLMNAFFSTKSVKGFLIVIEINDDEKPVQIDEIYDLLIEAEKASLSINPNP